MQARRQIDQPPLQDALQAGQARQPPRRRRAAEAAAVPISDGMDLRIGDCRDRTDQHRAIERLAYGFAEIVLPIGAGLRVVDLVVQPSS
jgi:hypothetical protein